MHDEKNRLYFQNVITLIRNHPRLVDRYPDFHLESIIEKGDLLLGRKRSLGERLRKRSLEARGG